MTKGKVYLIGAGPGDPELLTLKGKRALEEADVIVGDYLADSRILKFAKKGTDYIYVGKQSGCHAMKQQEISKLLAKLGEEGKVVARLKGGDPFVFGRGGEEIEVLREHGIPFEEVPGVTSAISAPAYAGIPVTHRGIATSFAVITGHEDPTKDKSSIHWEGLATGIDTLIFLMGVGHTELIATQLMKYGKSPETPVAFVRWGTRPYQETYTTTLEKAAEDVKRLGIRPPAVFVVGEVVSLRETMNWFEKQPLFGKRIAITRTRKQASHLSKVLDERGAQVYEIPTIVIEEPSDEYKSMDEALDKISTYDWIIFTSQNGVEHFFQRLYSKGLDTRALGHSKIATIGSATAKELLKHGIHADCIPSEYKAEGLLEAMKPLVRPKDRVLLPRAKVARSVLPEGLEELGCNVHVVEAYRTEKDTSAKEELIRLLENHEIDMVTFTSSSTVYHFMEQLDGKTELLNNVTLACIGPITADTCKKYNLTPSIVASTYTIDGLVDAMERGV